MSELIQHERVLPVELQQPPVFTDGEVAAILQAEAKYAAERLDADGIKAFERSIMGVTYDGTVVSLDELTVERHLAATGDLEFDQLFAAHVGALDLSKFPDATRDALTQVYSVVRVGHISQLTVGGNLPEERVSVLDSMNGSISMAFRGSGSFISTPYGNITYNPATVSGSETVLLPQLDGKVIFPIVTDGEPYEPSPTTAR